MGPKLEHWTDHKDFYKIAEHAISSLLRPATKRIRVLSNNPVYVLFNLVSGQCQLGPVDFEMQVTYVRSVPVVDAEVCIVLPYFFVMYTHGQYQRDTVLGVELHCVYESNIEFPYESAEDAQIRDTVYGLLRVMVRFFRH